MLMEGKQFVLYLLYYLYKIRYSWEVNLKLPLSEL